MNEYERIKKEALLTDEEMEFCYQKEYKEALAFSEKYDTSLSPKYFSPDRPADRQRSFDVTHREQVVRAIAQAQLDKVLKIKGIRIQCENQELPNYLTWNFEDRKLVRKLHQDMLKEGWVKCLPKEEHGS